MNIFKSRKFRQGAAATVLTVIGIVLIVVVNMLAGSLSEKFNLRADMTSEQLFTLSEESKEFIKTVDKDVEIYVLNTEENYINSGTYFHQALEVMNSYAKNSKYINVHFIDLMKNPTFTNQYTDLDLSTSDILIVSGENNAVLAVSDLLNVQVDYQSGQTYIASSKAEQALSSAILNVISENKVKVSVISGHGETDISDFENLLELNNYEISNVNLLTDEINEEADVLILCAPARDLTEAETKKLDVFLNNDNNYGKSLVYLASTQYLQEFPVLGAFLAEWGVAIGDGIVYETNQSKLFDASPFMVITDYAEEEYSSSFSAVDLLFAAPLSRPLEILFEAKSNVETSLLLEFTKGAGIMPGDKQEISADDLKATGPYPAMVLSRMITYDGVTPVFSNVVTCSTDMVLNQYFVGSTSFSNSDYMLNLFAQLTGKEDSMYIQNKTIASTQLGITYGTVMFIMIITMILLPIAVLVIGIIVWAKRRHK